MGCVVLQQLATLHGWGVKWSRDPDQLSHKHPFLQRGSLLNVADQHCLVALPWQASELLSKLAMAAQSSFNVICI